MRRLKLPLTLFILLLSIASQAQNWDIRLLQKINTPANPSADKPWQTLSKSAPVVDAGVPVAFLLVGLVKHNKSVQNKALTMGISYLSSSIITYGLKNTFQRQRPFEAYPNLIHKKGSGGSYSFPSGHTSAAFSTATSLSLQFPKWYVVAPAYAYAAAVGYSRMYLGVHYPSDVLAGAIIGSGTAYLSFKLNKKLQKRHN